ncbi:NAD-dependent epimerase/dehydratase family protein [Streptomyces sp. NPDC051561]|uniref:NAD-dependent epimerase/dehydratase family protein n=1 Tax=Streptomyces sp. NPDC051561 TaxID=3365658 RepID=UPI0037AA1B3C
MKALVLGGTGFVGSHLCEAFAAAGAGVLAVSTRGERPVDLLAPGGVDALAALLTAERPDVVVNAAGRAWRAGSEQMEQGNAVLVDRLLEALLTQPHRPRLIQLGSVHEYGPGAGDRGTPEDHEPAPVTPYGRTKLRGTRSVLRVAAAAGPEAVVLRLANVIGPGTPPGSLLRTVADLIAEAAAELRAGRAPEPLPFGGLTARRDFVDVADVADAVLAVASAPARTVAGQIVNIGSGEALPAQRLVERMVALSGLDLPLVAPRQAAARADVEWQRLDITKAHRLLGWRPRRAPDSSLPDLLEARGVRVHVHEAA